MLESDQEFDCPYCGQPNTARLDLSGGKRQVFVTDCAVCCRPIKITAKVDEEGEASLNAEREDGE